MVDIVEEDDLSVEEGEMMDEVKERNNHLEELVEDIVDGQSESLVYETEGMFLLPLIKNDGIEELNEILTDFSLAKNKIKDKSNDRNVGKIIILFLINNRKKI